MVKIKQLNQWFEKVIFKIESKFSNCCSNFGVSNSPWNWQTQFCSILWSRNQKIQDIRRKKSWIIIQTNMEMIINSFFISNVHLKGSKDEWWASLFFNLSNPFILPCQLRSNRVSGSKPLLFVQNFVSNNNDEW